MFDPHSILTTVAIGALLTVGTALAWWAAATGDSVAPRRRDPDATVVLPRVDDEVTAILPRVRGRHHAEYLGTQAVTYQHRERGREPGWARHTLEMERAA